MNRIQRTGLLSGLGILMLFWTLSTAAHAQVVNDSEQINQLLASIKTHAMNADNDAARLESYTRSRLSWQSHASQLTIIKEHVNDLINDYNDMKRLRDSGSTWQQESIDRLEPLVQEMSNHLTTTIQHLNEHPLRIHMQPYRDYVRANQELVGKTHAIIKDFVEYGDAKAKADSLEQKLELPEGSNEGN